jgi:hypothetical protein
MRASYSSAAGDGRDLELVGEGVGVLGGREHAAGDVDVAHRALQARVGDGRRVVRDAVGQEPPAGGVLRHRHGFLRALVRRRDLPLRSSSTSTRTETSDDVFGSSGRQCSFTRGT